MLLPVILLLVFGLLQFGLVLHEYLLTNEAAREGARMASLGADNQAIEIRVKRVAGSYQAQQLTIAIQPFNRRLVGEDVTVIVSAVPTVILPYVDQWVPQRIEGRVVMLVEQDSR